MPILEVKNISTSKKLGVWKISETIDELKNLASQLPYTIELPVTKIENKQKQWLAVRLLLNELLPNAQISYNELGKPMLSNDWNISISHTNDFAAVIINMDEECGIDIESISNKVAKIKHKFLSSKDLAQLQTDEELTIYWSAKETLYKYYGKKEVLFIENLFIDNFKISSPNFTGKIDLPNYKKELNLAWQKIENSILVYTV